MNSSVETRYPFLDEDVSPSWPRSRRATSCGAAARQVPAAQGRRPLAAARDRPAAQGDVPRPLRQLPPRRRPAVRRAAAQRGIAAEDRLFRHRRGDALAQGVPVAAGRSSRQRVSIEMGLVGVLSTQLWHHTFIDGSLADLPLVRPAAISPPPAAGRVSRIARGRPLPPWPRADS